MCIEDHVFCGPHREQEGEEDSMFQKTPGDHPVKVVTQEVQGSEEGRSAECSGVSRWAGGEAGRCAHVFGDGTCGRNCMTLCGS